MFNQITKQPKLKLKIWPKLLLGSLPLIFALSWQSLFGSSFIHLVHPIQSMNQSLLSVSPFSFSSLRADQQVSNMELETKALGAITLINTCFTI
jgi:hypothetical protein